MLMGIAAVETPDDALIARIFSRYLECQQPDDRQRPGPAAIDDRDRKKLTLYDFGVEGMGQGLAGQMTPFQMALIASVPANMEGKLMKPRIEADLPPQMFSQVLTPQQAAAIRDIMSP